VALGKKGEIKLPQEHSHGKPLQGMAEHVLGIVGAGCRLQRMTKERRCAGKQGSERWKKIMVKTGGDL
jgi:hypothetical protein